MALSEMSQQWMVGWIVMPILWLMPAKNVTFCTLIYLLNIFTYTQHKLEH